MNPFSFPAVGLDISDESVKYLAFRERKDLQEIDFFGEFDIPVGLVATGEIKDVAGLTRFMKDKLKAYAKNSIHDCFPA